MSDDIDLTPAAVTAMLEGVTQGPWSVDDRGEYIDGGTPASEICNTAGAIQNKSIIAANARFIAWAREAVPALSARLAEVEADLEQRKADNKRWRHETVNHTNSLITRAERAEAQLAQAVKWLRDIEGRSRPINPTGNPKWINDHANKALARIAKAAKEAGE